MRGFQSLFPMRMDAANPGHFFACCGLLEVAHRLWVGTEGWFERDAFHIAAADRTASLEAMVAALEATRIQPEDADVDEKVSPLRLSSDRLSLRLDWWLDEAGVGRLLKTWAGQQNVAGISRAMLHAAVARSNVGPDWFDYGTVARDPRNPREAVAPFYFDARRFAHALDAGFSIDATGVQAVAYPAVEILAFMGLQRFRPATTELDRWTFEYFTWGQPLGVSAAAAVASGAVDLLGRQRFRFRLEFRDDQKRYKAFGIARPIGGDS